jgi:microcystin-dependent protein
MARTSRPAASYINNLTDPPPAGDGVAGWVAWAERLLNAVRQIPGVDPAFPVALSSDSFAPDYAGMYVLSSETGSPNPDTLASIGTTGVADGQQIQIRAASASQVITVQHGTSSAGQIELADGANLVMSDVTMVLTLEYRSATTRWHEVARQYGNAKSAARSFLGLAIGSAVQAFNTNLAALSGLTGAANKLAYFTGAGALALADLTSKARDLLACTDEAAMRTFLGVTSSVPTGAWLNTFATTPASGWVFLDGNSIGNASSSATNRANADTEQLFILLWNAMANAEAPVSGGRGASAAADFAANKRLTLPDARGRVAVGKDNMGGSAASRITTGGAGFDGTVLGIAGGSQTHTLTTAEIPAHVHSGGAPASGSGNISNGGSPVANTGNTGSQGGGGAHNNTQPSLITNVMIKL